MRSTRHGTGQFSGSAFISAIVARWQEYRMIRDLESMPFDVMKDIGFRAAERTNAQ